MIITDIIQAVTVVGICIYALFSDFLKGKIKNKVLAIASMGLIVNLLVKFIFIDSNDIVLYLQNTGVILLLSVICYISKLWAGGDCKLALFIAFFFPTIFYYDYNDIKFTLWGFLLMSFCIGFIWLVFDSIYRLVRDKEREIGTSLILLKKSIFIYVKSFIYLTALNQVYQVFINPYIQINFVIWFAISIGFVFFINCFKITDIKLLIGSVGAFDVVMMIITGNYSIFTYWQNYILVLVFIVMRVFMSRYNYQTIKTSEINEGMILSRITSLAFQKSRVKGLPNISDESLKSRLTKEEAESVRRWENSKYGESEIIIVRKLPFAAFISIGLFFYLCMGVLQYCGLI